MVIGPVSWRPGVHCLYAPAFRPQRDDVQRPMGLPDAKQVLQWHAQEPAKQHANDTGVGHHQRKAADAVGAGLALPKT